jgi:transposase InsO family protein
MRYKFIREHRDEFRIKRMCGLFNVTRAGYYAWRPDEAGPRALENKVLVEKIRTEFKTSRKTYGSPRICGVLGQAGINVSRKRVARLMREAGLRARATSLYHPNPGTHAFFTSVPNRIRKLEISGVDQVWVGDITYLKVGSVYRYLAVVMDKYSRRVIGWAYGKRKDVALTLKALNRAVRYRKPPRGLIFHTDRGIEYAAGLFKARLVELGITQSMNRPGKVTDNAHIESFFHSMKSEIYHGLRFDEDRQMRAALREYMPFYNRGRLHSSLNYVSPATYERQVQ